MIIGTAGHIDHGKTSLVKKLTGIDTDRLLEEKKRGITIELGFAYKTAENGERLGFVDVPGHEKLIATMATGAASIDFALLVIAAKDGIMPQTREHLDILSLMGITKGAVALTQIDLVDRDRLIAVEQDIQNFTQNSFLQNAPIFPVSSLTGQGINELWQFLSDEAQEFKHRPIAGRFRQTIDRAFSVKGAGTVITGSVLSGKIHKNDDIIVAPHHYKGRIRTLHVQNEEKSQAISGDRAALNLVGDMLTLDHIKRGDMVIDPFLDQPTNRFDVRLQVLNNEKKNLQQWFPVRFHHGARDMAARLVFLESDEGRPNSKPLVQIVSEEPIIAASFDHFIIRDTSASRTIGGGFIIDPFAPARKRRSPQRMAILDALENRNHAEALTALLAIEPFFVNWQEFCRARNLTDKEAEDLLTIVKVKKIATNDGTVILSDTYFAAINEKVSAILTDFHAMEPDLQGIGLEQLRRQTAPELKAPFFRLLLQEGIKQKQYRIFGAWVGLFGHEAHLSAEDEAIFQKISPILNGDLRFKPPRTRDFANDLTIDESHMRAILKASSRMGRVYEVAQDYFFPKPVLAQIIDIMRDIASQKEKGIFVAADLRDRLDNGRKIAILLLEFFDRHGVTIRRGDERRLNPYRLDLFSDTIL
ncbi:selenocysteine-specific translation elongation factor [Bartonella sp. HY406]|uniref:selenocysteine-specific translation elongation factor n=1 Tax=Bartonella sp. HY406 TaxID=2979331 RepID=UPI0021C9BAB6|nr:selenocysteine-specific translation elongation factor [Bartonella sp. HY406]UXN03103.1 selenocysteine-specific translation elongation factor [Bartonella sp. HY406]